MKKERSYKKTHESIIGKIIYGFLLFMPLLAIGVTCGYAIFNKNAYQSYGEKYIKSEQVVNDNSLLMPNNNYSFNAKTYFDNAEGYTNGGKYQFNTSNITDWNIFFSGTSALTPQENESIDGFVFYFANNKRLNLYSGETQVKTIIESGNVHLNNLETTIYFNLKSIGIWNIGSYSNTYSTNSTYLIQYEIQEISDVFYYSVEKVEQSQYFNWANNSIVHTVLVETCTELSITNTFIPMLLSYWLIITVIYILYDIALIMLMMAHRKIHELQDSF